MFRKREVPRKFLEDRFINSAVKFHQGRMLGRMIDQEWIKNCAEVYRGGNRLYLCSRITSREFLLTSTSQRIQPFLPRESSAQIKVCWAVMRRLKESMCYWTGDRFPWIFYAVLLTNRMYSHEKKSALETEGVIKLPITLILNYSPLFFVRIL